MLINGCEALFKIFDVRPDLIGILDAYSPPIRLNEVYLERFIQ